MFIYYGKNFYSIKFYKRNNTFLGTFILEHVGERMMDINVIIIADVRHLSRGLLCSKIKAAIFKWGYYFGYFFGLFSYIEFPARPSHSRGARHLKHSP